MGGRLIIKEVEILNLAVVPDVCKNYKAKIC